MHNITREQMSAVVKQQTDRSKNWHKHEGTSFQTCLLSTSLVLWCQIVLLCSLDSSLSVRPIKLQSFKTMGVCTFLVSMIIVTLFSAHSTKTYSFVQNLFRPIISPQRLSEQLLYVIISQEHCNKRTKYPKSSYPMLRISQDITSQ